MTNANTIGSAVFSVTTERTTETSLDNATVASLSVTTSSWQTFNSSNFSPYKYFVVVVSLIGIVANGLLSLSMIKSSRSSVNTTHALIASQCLIDAFYSIASFLSYFVGNVSPKNYSQPPTMFNMIRCVLIDSGTMSAVFQNSSMTGLIAITAERYWKVVYPIGHRKYYRPWMTRVTIGVTWLSGFVTFLLPSVFTTRILYGRCYITAVWPSVAASKVYGLFQFCWMYFIPIMIFLTCYWRILLVVRKRQVKVTAVGTGDEPMHVNAGDSANNQRTLQVATNNSVKLTGAELNITLTMISVTACYGILMLPSYVLYLLQVVFQVPVDFAGPGQTFLIGLGFINPIVNPFIYAVRYHDVRRTWRAMLMRHTETEQTY